MVGIDTGEPTDGFYDHVRELPDVRADLGNAHLLEAATAMPVPPPITATARAPPVINLVLDCIVVLFRRLYPSGTHRSDGA
jgi:hypothetical protein